MTTDESTRNESVKIVSGNPEAVAGSSGEATQLPGESVTVSAAAAATGGIGAGNFIGTAIDRALFTFNSEDTPLMNMMLSAKRVNVNSPEVEHFVIDEPRSSAVTTADTGGDGRTVVVLPVSENDTNALRPHTTLLVRGVNGYDSNGEHETPGKYLMLFVTGQDPTTNCPVVRAVNGMKNNPADDYGTVPLIPGGTTVVILANSLYETQKEVDPDLVLPRPTRVYLQKRGMNQVVSDYFASQKKRLPFSKAVIAEQAIANFKVRGNRTLWAGRAGKFKVNVPRMGMQYVYTTEGLRWQFRREIQERGKWTVEKVIALAKMFFTGEDVPKSAILLAGKNLLEAIQTIDYSKHPEILITTKVNSVGWTVTNFHTVFGDIEIKREPTLDRLGWSNSGALIGENRLVHYVYASEHSFEDRVEGEEATRNGLLIWDAVALKGTCHIWIDGEGGDPAQGVRRIQIWESGEAPRNPKEGTVFYLMSDCPGISKDARTGQLWEVAAVSADGAAEWRRASGELV